MNLPIVSQNLATLQHHAQDPTERTLRFGLTWEPHLLTKTRSLGLKLYKRLNRPLTMKPVRKTSLWRLDCSTTVAVTIMVTLLIFTSLLCCASLALKAQVAKNYNCNLDTPSLPTTPNHVTKRSLKKGNNTLQLQFKEQQDGMVQFDLCSVITCGSNEKEHEGSEKYICVVPDNMGKHDEEWYPYWYCPSWSYVIANTGLNDWGYHPTKASTGPNPLKKHDYPYLKLHLGLVVKDPVTH